MKSFIVATLIATLLPTAAMATTGMPGRGGDGHCPIKELATDPDCAREGAQWRGTGRVDDDQAKSKRDEFPQCRASGGGQQTVYTCKGNPRNEFPGDRPRQPRHLG
jgi:hypothetical protein